MYKRHSSSTVIHNYLLKRNQEFFQPTSAVVVANLLHFILHFWKNISCKTVCLGKAFTALRATVCCYGILSSYVHAQKSNSCLCGEFELALTQLDTLHWELHIVECLGVLNSTLTMLGTLTAWAPRHSTMCSSLGSASNLLYKLLPILKLSWLPPIYKLFQNFIWGQPYLLQFPNIQCLQYIPVICKEGKHCIFLHARSWSWLSLRPSLKTCPLSYKDKEKMAFLFFITSCFITDSVYRSCQKHTEKYHNTISQLIHIGKCRNAISIQGQSSGVFLLGAVKTTMFETWL